jgi:hypothetical protein
MSLSGDTAATLAWTDFQGTVPANATRKALTVVSYDVQTPTIFRIDGKTKKQKDFRLSGVTVKLTIEKTQMWSQTSGQTTALLGHEQGHYEITALLMRDLESDLTALFNAAKTYPTVADLKKDVDALETPIIALLNSIQTVETSKGTFVDGLYDQQTKDGTDAKAQAKWAAAFTAARSTAATRLKDALTAQNITVP